MEYNNISTNILRDESKDLNYVVTPNAIQIYERIVGSALKSNKSFTLIGNYGTGKSHLMSLISLGLGIVTLLAPGEPNIGRIIYAIIGFLFSTLYVVAIALGRNKA
mgnify:CR=1 FL=1